MATLNIGDTAPSFELSNQAGDTVSLDQFAGGKVLVYFYPKADTPGCTVQSCAVRDSRETLAAAGITGIGVSPDAPTALQKFDTKFDLGFSLLSDEDHTVAEAYGVWGEKSMYGKTYMGIIRSSFLINESGKIEGAWYKVKPEDTVPLALETVS